MFFELDFTGKSFYFITINFIINYSSCLLQSGRPPKKMLRLRELIN